MSSSSTRDVVCQFYASMSSGAAPESIALLFSEDASLDIPGATDLVPWIGKRAGRDGVAAFVRDLREHVESIAFEVTAQVAEGDKAVTIGRLQSRVKKTGKIIGTDFATEFTVRDGKIVHYRFFEDSYAVAEAVRRAGE